jgi:Cu(I)/Ag(I) efflux system membrane fusion protein
MKKILLVMIAVLALAAAFSWGKKMVPATPSNQASHKDVYYCPMHPHYTSDRPGNCPICGMKLVKKESAPQSTSLPPEQKAQNGVPDHATVAIDLQKQQLIGIKTIEVSRKPVVKTIHAYGYVAHDLELYEAQLDYIEAWRKYYAFVIRRPTKDQFRQDWWKYDVTAPNQDRWHSEDKRKAQEQLAKAEYELIHMGLSHEQIAQLREIKYGQPWIQPDLLFFDKNYPFWIYAQVPESELGYLAPTQKVKVTIPIYGDTTEGVIKNIAPFVDPATRTSRVRIEMPKYRGELSVNMYANVDIPVELDNTIAIPREAIMDTGLRKIVFVQVKDGIFEPRDIETGLDGDGLVTVKSGLKEGERIVAAGNFLLDSESRLQSSLGGPSHD